MKKLLMASTCLAFGIGYESEVVETVVVGGVRYNKADYEADQALPEGQRQIKGSLSKAASADPEKQSTPAGVLETGGPPLAAPSAPDFSGGGTDAQQIDPLKDAAAPVAHGENARLVLKSGSGAKPYKVVDGAGNPIEMDGIDPKGYATEQGAWDAIRALPH